MFFLLHLALYSYPPIYSIYYFRPLFFFLSHFLIFATFLFHLFQLTNICTRPFCIVWDARTLTEIFAKKNARSQHIIHVYCISFAISCLNLMLFARHFVSFLISPNSTLKWKMDKIRSKTMLNHFTGHQKQHRQYKNRSGRECGLIQRIFYCLRAIEIGHCVVCTVHTKQPTNKNEFLNDIPFSFKWQNHFLFTTQSLLLLQPLKKLYIKLFSPNEFHFIYIQSVRVCFGWSPMFFFISFNFRLNRIFIVQLAWLL